jgi:putative Ca2+/H+ antiporter (TMEM165/GDT1 family)
MIIPDATSNWRHVMIWYILIAGAVTIVLDAMADWLGGDKSTITVITRDAEAGDVIVALIIGIIAGHLTARLWWVAMGGVLIGALAWSPWGMALLRRWGLAKP